MYNKIIEKIYRKKDKNTIFAKNCCMIVMENKLIAFIINPISGSKNKNNIVNQIKTADWFAKNTVEIYFTKCAGDAFENAKKYVERNFDIVVAVGGDGTINEIACALIHTKTALAIIPCGSGNGLARELHIPLKANKALQLLTEAKISDIDVCYFNEHPYFCTAGVGFDAAVSKVFAESGKRGFFSYLISGLNAYIKMKPVRCKLTIGDETISAKAFDITFANAKQFGNNAYISPLADLRDGIIDVVLIRSFPWFSCPIMGMRLFMKNIHKSKYVKIYKCKHAVLEVSENDCAHYDGESVPAKTRIEIKIEPLALKVVSHKSGENS
ncbi:MAG: diacylglycerol kinase family lipid kinase [Prevotellaceae bacterium]|jgi:YegS/Rv2252/BmrU family lipid kinase|nr:diacylglycerol kinase family lipid kinase [Prevotellaceae bacterium]